jgi:cytochrome c-type biogenesis protein CcmH/NrfG
VQRENYCFPSAPLKNTWHFLACVILFLTPRTQAEDRSTSSSPVLHAVRGRVVPIGGRPLGTAKVRLAAEDGKEIGERNLEYEGRFDFESLLPGRYVLTLEREEEATIGRAVEIKSYPTPKIVFLEITLNGESASVRELITEASNQEVGVRREAPTQVSRKALRAFDQAAKESASGSPEKAIVELQRAIREQPDYFEAHNNLGVQYQKLRQWDQAIQSYRRAIELRPNSSKAYVNLAAVLLERAEIQPATDTLEAARKVAPGSVQVHTLLGELYFRKHDYVKAQECLETATRLSPQDSRGAFGLLIQIALQDRHLDQARQYLNVMKKYFPSDPETKKIESTIQSATQP